MGIYLRYDWKGQSGREGGSLKGRDGVFENTRPREQKQYTFFSTDVIFYQKKYFESVI